MKRRTKIILAIVIPLLVILLALLSNFVTPYGGYKFNFYHFPSPRDIPKLVRIAEGEDVGKRFMAVKALAQFPEYMMPWLSQLQYTAVVDALKHASTDPEREIRMLAMAAFGNLPASTPGGLDILRQGMSDDDTYVVEAAGASIAKLGANAKSLVPDLVALLEDDDYQYKEPVMVALGGIGPDAIDAAPVILDILERSEDGRLILTSVKALTTISLDDAVNGVMFKLKGDSQPWQRSALAGLREAPPEPEVYDVFALALQNEDIKTRIYAVRSMDDFGFDLKPFISVLKEIANNPALTAGDQLFFSRKIQEIENAS